MTERLQKYLAQAGLASRRQVEDWIRAGRLSIDGNPAELGSQVTGSEKIRLDGRLLTLGRVRSRVLAYYKPVGLVTTRDDPEKRATVFDRLPRLQQGRWVAVGRLDVNTQGLLLLTTDGELANGLMHPSSQIEREYAVRVMGDVSNDTLQQLRDGVMLDDGPAHFDDIQDIGGSGANHWYHVVLREGRHREVRRLWESQGVTVSRLVRVRFGTVALRRGLRPGHWDELEDNARAELMKIAGIYRDPKAAVQQPPATGRPRAGARGAARHRKPTRRR